MGKLAAVFIFTLLLNDLAAQSAWAQIIADINGNYSVTESWSVTLQLGNGSGITRKTYTGTETGTLAITNGTYTLINHVGPVKIDLAQTIYVYGDGSYDVPGDYPLYGIGNGDGSFLAVIQLTFFVIKVPLPSETGFSGGDAALSSILDARGTSLASLSGAGSVVDANAPDTDSGYLNEVDASSTASAIEQGGPAPTPTPTPGLCGDVDQSGSITVTDGVQTLRAAAGLSSNCTLLLCDVDGSGAITVSDGVNVLRAAAGLTAIASCPQQ